MVYPASCQFVAVQSSSEIMFNSPGKKVIEGFSQLFYDPLKDKKMRLWFIKKHMHFSNIKT